MEHLRCVVERITYQNDLNGYSVIKCRAKGWDDLVTVVGNMPDVHVGSVLYLGGAWRIDPKYGRQFAMETFEETLPATVYGMEKYLGSGLVKGIGPKFAQRIVKAFGENTLDVIEEEPERLLEVEGIGKVRVDRIKKSWADQIAEKMGFDHEKYVRLRSGLLYSLNRLSESGHCYATREMLLKTGGDLLSVEDYLLTMTLDEMVRAEDVITETIETENQTERSEKIVPMTFEAGNVPENEPANRSGNTPGYERHPHFHKGFV